MKTYEELVNILSMIEPDEGMYEMLTEEDIPHLQQMLNENQPWLASRAVFALSKLKSDKVNSILLQLVDDQRPEVRIALASSAAFLTKDLAEDILVKLIADDETGVRKFAIQSISSRHGTSLIKRLEDVQKNEKNEYLKDLINKKIFEIH
jgi:HEAT repeat protein